MYVCMHLLEPLVEPDKQVSTYSISRFARLSRLSGLALVALGASKSLRSLATINTLREKGEFKQK